jgi:bacteriorhodopsin
MYMNFLLSLGSLIFLASSVYFLYYSKKKFNSAFFVSFITLISYLIMLEGSFIVSELLWTRWLGYAVSCSLLIFVIAKRIGLDHFKQVTVIFLNIIVMVTGALSSVNINEFKILFFVIGAVAYCILLFEIFKSKSKKLKPIAPFILYGWSAFPIVFIISNEGLNIISSSLSLIIYLFLDVVTKVIFYLKNDLSTKE